MMEKQLRTRTNLTAGSAGVGGAAGVIAVFVLAQAGIDMGTEQAAMLTAALGTIFAWLVRFMPQPKA